MEFVDIKYKLSSSENFDDFLKVFGVNFFVRKMASSASPTVVLTRDGEAYVLHSHSALRSRQTRFTPGDTFDERRMDGVKMRSVCTLEGSTLKQEQTAEDGLLTIIVRQFGPDEMKQIMTVKDVTCTMIYKRL